MKTDIEQMQKDLTDVRDYANCERRDHRQEGAERMTVRVNHDVIVAIDRARCPQCGDMVFVPSVRLPPDDLTDPVVWCRDMGHWQGRLSECDNSADQARI